ncbi:2-amino-4-hydroxy-6-hydroxymethyldihydropteridinediphosphokinase [soil metagenome]
MEVEIITAYISLGSNLGDRAGNLLLAVRGLLEASMHVHRLSAIYETEPVGVAHADDYLNMVAEIQVLNITPAQMLARMIRIEYLLGRRNKFENAPRTVDLDLLFYGDNQINTPFLTLPHPRLHKRKFVLVPMAELTPHFVHPVFNKTIQELLSEVGDVSSVKRWNPNAEKENKKIFNQQIHTSFSG